MTINELSTDIEAALRATNAWADAGWSMTFGKQLRPVNSLREAEALEESFVYRLEAQSYWRRVREAAKEAAVWGERALAAVRKGDVRDADDALYFALYLERPIRGDAPVWGPVYQKFKRHVS